MSSNLAIDARHLTRKFGDKVAVADATFQVGSSEVFGFLGPNGAGKTTTTKMLTTLLPSTSGSASILGFDLRTQGSRIRERIGVVQQQDSFDQGLNVETSMDIYGLLWGVPKRLRRDRIEELIEKFSMEEFRKMSSLDLSTGQRRRLQVAREFIHDMDLLFLDEPTVGLDPIVRRNALNYFKEKVRDGLSIFFTTHILEEAEYLCDRLAVINHGRIDRYYLQIIPDPSATSLHKWKTVDFALLLLPEIVMTPMALYGDYFDRAGTKLCNVTYGSDNRISRSECTVLP